MRRLALTLVTISSPFALASCAGLSSDTEPPLQPPVLCSTDTTTRDAMIHDALLSHPEWLMEMSQAMRQRQQAAQQQTAKQAIAQNHDTLFADPADPVAGNPAGAVTVVLFFDASCPYCKQVSPDIDRLMQENPDVRVIFKEFPILGPASQLAATAGLASLKQGKYDAFHRALMADKTPEHQLAEPHLMEIAKSVGLDGWSCVPQAGKIRRLPPRPDGRQDARTPAGRAAPHGDCQKRRPRWCAAEKGHVLPRDRPETGGQYRIGAPAWHHRNSRPDHR